jgi:hypothetical protein
MDSQNDWSNPAPEPSHDDIARLAYSLWESREHGDGSPDEDWFRAEELLNSK